MCGRLYWNFATLWIYARWCVQTGLQMTLHKQYYVVQCLFIAGSCTGAVINLRYHNIPFSLLHPTHIFLDHCGTFRGMISFKNTSEKYNRIYDVLILSRMYFHVSVSRPASVLRSTGSSEMTASLPCIFWFK